jgi:hypothetical protein
MNMLRLSRTFVNSTATRTFSTKVLQANLVSLEYADLVAGKDLTKEIEKGWNPTRFINFISTYNNIRIWFDEPLQSNKILKISKIKFWTKQTTAYSFNGMGVLAVLNIPGVKEKRAEILPLARKFAELPDQVKAK